ncbi:MAG: transglutaminaseTgpA domain-containing protein [Actinomycetota bacterium]|nr:transglutaminaseTgpA domain-containing protein [Actinomycetota bacterium]
MSQQRAPTRPQPARLEGSGAIPVSATSDDASSPEAKPGPAWPIAAEIALVGVTASAAIGFLRVFSDNSFLVPVLIAVVFSHIVASAGRHFGLPPMLAGFVSALAILLITALVVEPGTTTAGLPLLGTWRALGHDLHEAWQRFGEVRAPTAVIPGFLAAAACGAGLAGALADGLAFRARARFEALAPSFTLFTVGALLGSDKFRITTTALYLAAVLVFVLVSAPIGRGNQTWFSGKSSSGETALLRGGLATAAIALVIGLVVGPHLPGAHSLGLVGMRDGAPKGSSSRVTVSPLVDIRSRLVDQSSTQMFTVESQVPSYWRLTSLGRFDGNIWSSLGSYQPASGQLSGDSQTGTSGPPVFQKFAIQALSSIWLPAAYRPQRFEGPGGTRYDADSSSLLTDAPSSDGLNYGVLSKPPAVTAEQLASAKPVAPNGDLSRYLALPDGFPDRVTRLAAEITFGASTPYDKARALQDWFRSSFTYDLNVAPGHDDSAIERFLFVTRRGYCEQFAGSYAAMARSLGLPARVGVGFTSGDKAGDGLFHVTGKEAHAWPEVYFTGFGWIPFEPTPGRAVPSGASYTGVNPQTPDPAVSPTPSTPVTAPAPGVPTTQPGASPSTQAPSGQPPTSAPAREAGGGGPSSLLLAVAAGIVLAVLYLIAVPVLRRARRARLRAAATTPTEQVLRAWQEAQEDLSLAGVRSGAAETAHEFASRAGTQSDEISRALNDLAEQWTVASYSPNGVGRVEAERATAAANTVRADLAMRATPLRRLAWLLDPRPLLQKQQLAR